MIMNDIEIIYAISTGDVPKKMKMDLLKKHIESIKRQERVSISNKILNEEYSKSESSEVEE